MKVRICKYTLFCGTLSLCLLGVVPQMKATTKLNDLAVVQQANKVTGTVKDALGPIIGASVMEKGTRRSPARRRTLFQYTALSTGAEKSQRTTPTTAVSTLTCRTTEY